MSGLNIIDLSKDSYGGASFLAYKAFVGRQVDEMLPKEKKAETATELSGRVVEGFQRRWYEPDKYFGLTQAMQDGKIVGSYNGLIFINKCPNSGKGSIGPTLEVLKQKFFNNEKFEGAKPENTCLSLGVSVDKDYRRRGIALELIKKSIKVAKERGAKYIVFRYDVDNKASEKVFNKLKASMPLKTGLAYNLFPASPDYDPEWCHAAKSSLTGKDETVVIRILSLDDFTSDS